MGLEKNRVYNLYTFQVMTDFVIFRNGGVAAILDFAIGKKCIRRLVSRVQYHDPDILCPNRMNGIGLPSRNVIFEP